MTFALPYCLALGIGIVAGLRSMTAPAAASWAAHTGRLHLAGTALASLAASWLTYLLIVLALAELVADKLPMTPSRTRPGPFAGRLLTGALSGAAVSAGLGRSLAAGAVLGVLGAAIGTIGGYLARRGLVRALNAPDFVIALGEDVVAIGGALLIVTAH